MSSKPRAIRRASSGDCTHRIGGASGAGGETRSRSICSPITAASNRPIASHGTAGRDAVAGDVALT